MYITTSWDDGHPSDYRLAELLAEAGLAATFYIPRRSQRQTLNDSGVRDLASRFEIGAHTLDHLSLNTLSDSEAAHQIGGSKSWIEEVTGQPCSVFCPPLGKFRRSHVDLLDRLGFVGFRTVELGAGRPISGPQRCLELPTTVQAHPHSNAAYLKNALRRFRLPAMMRTLRLWRHADWVARAERLLEESVASNGVFHLWGHSWEIDEHGQWENLKKLMDMLSELVRCKRAVTITNAELCRSVSRN